MKTIHKQVIIIGGGPGGLAAAAELKKSGIDGILILEREHWLGGILRQCIHDGFGLTRFGETLSGPEYAQRFIDQAEALGIEAATDTTVISLSQDRIVTAVSKKRPGPVPGRCRHPHHGLPGTDPRSPVHPRRTSFRRIHSRRGPGLYESEKQNDRPPRGDPWFRRYRHDHGEAADPGGRKGRSGF